MHLKRLESSLGGQNPSSRSQNPAREARIEPVRLRRNARSQNPTQKFKILPGSLKPSPGSQNHDYFWMPQYQCRQRTQPRVQSLASEARAQLKKPEFKKEFRMDSERNYKGLQKDSGRIQKGFKRDSTRIQKEFKKGSKRIQEGFKKGSKNIRMGFRKNSKRNQTVF